MSYCPKCRHEYAESVQTCIDCGRKLRSGHRPVDTSLEFEDYLIPLGSFGCAVIALLLLYLKYATQAGWIQGTFAQTVAATQPQYLTAFYTIAVVISTAILVIWLVQVLLRRR